MATQLKVEFPQCWTGSTSWWLTTCLHSKNGYLAQAWVPPVLDWFHILVTDQMSPFKEWILSSRLSSPSVGLVPLPGNWPGASILQENGSRCCLGKINTWKAHVEVITTSIIYYLMTKLMETVTWRKHYLIYTMSNILEGTRGRYFYCFLNLWLGRRVLFHCGAHIWGSPPPLWHKFWGKTLK